MYNKILAATTVISKHSHRTPVLTSRTLDKFTGNQVFLKCENFQRTGSFKFRGAYNAASLLNEEERKRGIITYSSGNHAQAVALTGRIFKTETIVVVPNNIPEVKLKAAKNYGAKAVMYDPEREDRETVARKLADEHGYVLIPSYEQEDVIAGQGTVAKELLDDVFSLDYLFVPCGGGGLLSGCAIYTKRNFPKCRVIGVEPQVANDAYQSFRSGQISTVKNPKTIADGLRTPCLGKMSFDFIKQFVDDMVSVSEEEIIESMYYLWTRLKIVIEPSGAVSLAPVLFNKIPGMQDKRVGVVLSGGNVDVRKMGELFQGIKPENI